MALPGAPHARVTFPVEAESAEFADTLVDHAAEQDVWVDALVSSVANGRVFGLRRHRHHRGVQRIDGSLVNPGLLYELVDRRKQGGTRPGQSAGSLGADCIGQRVERRVAQVVYG